MDLEDLWTPVSPRTLREVVDRLCEAGHVVADAPVDDRRVITECVRTPGVSARVTSTPHCRDVGITVRISPRRHPRAALSRC